jgi:hypothetical protein
MNRLTLVTTVYNEEHRIEPWLRHAVLWADEIVVFDKGSTDKTLEILSRFNVRVIGIPFSGVGQEDWIWNAKQINTDWFAWSTPSEFITPNLAKILLQVARANPDEMDSLSVRNKVYSFGKHNPRSQMGEHFVGKMFNLKRIDVVNEVHTYFRSKGGMRSVPDRDGLTHVLHMGQPSYEAYLRRTIDYAEMELNATPDQLLKKAEAFVKRSDDQNFVFLSGHEGHDLRHALAWKVSNLLNALACLDAVHGEKTKEVYKELTAEYMGMWGLS